MRNERNVQYPLQHRSDYMVCLLRGSSEYEADLVEHLPQTEEEVLVLGQCLCFA